MIVEMFPLKQWQKDLFKLYNDNPKDKWFVIKAKRQVGKSICLEGLLIAASLKKENSFSLFVSPTLAQARKVYQEVTKIASELIKSANGSLLEITFINDSIIKFGSGQQADSLRGFTIKGSGLLMIDEAAYILDDVFYSILVPTTNVNKSDIFIVSTPKFKRGFFYNLWCTGLGDDEKIISVDWNKYDTSEFLPPETLAIYREQMPRLAFQSEFLAEFIDGEGSVFTDFKKCIGETSLNSSSSIISVDWGTGTGSDYTVLTVGQIQNGKAVVAYQKAFNDKNTTDTINYIVREAIATKAECVIVEKNAIGNVYGQLLNDALPDDVQMQYFNTSNKSKDKIIKQLIAAFEQEKIMIPNDTKLITELSAFECQINNNGLPIYGAPNGLHDDRVMSLAFFLNNIYYEI